MRIFINDRPFDASEGSDIQSAVVAADPSLAARLADGTAYVTDGRGIRMTPDAPLSAGSILRVVVRARRHDSAADADA
jgi:hypothetical protein